MKLKLRLDNERNIPLVLRREIIDNMIKLRSEVNRHYESADTGKTVLRTQLTSNLWDEMQEFGSSSALAIADDFGLDSVLAGVRTQKEIEEQDDLERKRQMMEAARNTEAYLKAQTQNLPLEDAPTEEQIEAIIERGYKAAQIEYQLTRKDIPVNFLYHLFEREYPGYAKDIYLRYLAIYPPIYSQNKQTMKP